jgi:hypothetical protein
MGRRNLKSEVAGATERVVISGYVRLCINEGRNPDDAYCEMKRKIEMLKSRKAKEAEVVVSTH